MSLKKKIWEKLDKDGYITDSELAKIYGGEPNWSTAEEYKRRWGRLKSDREYFADKEITGVWKSGKRHIVDLKYNSRYCSKDFYEEIKPRFQKFFKDKRYFYIYKGKEIELYNIKEKQGDINFYDCEANWKRPDENDRECLGNFYLKDLIIK